MESTMKRKEYGIYGTIQYLWYLRVSLRGRCGRKKERKLTDTYSKTSECIVS